MPQMAPLSWTLLFIYFTIIFLTINPLNFFNFKYYPNKKLMTKQEFKINWKW
uniref:ATP synthase complex subunit 8 n=1 Tax=Gastrallus laevigatus TaxID=1586484 RepID=A0A343C2Y7_9COLE|nr:ATP synthase F0 subunit 8 [Gastrallus laevigatus]